MNAIVLKVIKAAAALVAVVGGGAYVMDATGVTRFGGNFIGVPYTIVASTSTRPATTTRMFGDLSPQVNNQYSLGEPGFAWSNVYTSGTSVMGDIIWTNATGTSTTSTNFAVTGSGTSTFAGAVSSTRFVADTRYLAGDGSINNPAYSFLGDGATGLYLNGSGNLAVRGSTNVQLVPGAGTWGFGASLLSLATGNLYDIGTSATPLRNIFVGTNVSSTLFTANLGVVGTPSITFSGDGDTGIYSAAANEFDVTAGGSKALSITATTSTIPTAVSSTRLMVSGDYVYMPKLSAPSGASGVFVCYDTNAATLGRVSRQATNCTVSSAYFKEHIASLSTSDMMEEVRALRAVEYDRKQDGKHEKGFVAEEVARIDPTLVVYAEPDEERLAFVKANYPDTTIEKDGKTLVPQTVDYMRFTSVLTAALQDVDERLTKLESRMSVLERFMEWIKSLFNM